MQIVVIIRSIRFHNFIFCIRIFLVFSFIQFLICTFALWLDLVFLLITFFHLDLSIFIFLEGICFFMELQADGDEDEDEEYIAVEYPLFPVAVPYDA